MIFRYSIPNGFGDRLSLLIEAPSREGADRLAAGQIAVAHAPGGKGHRVAHPSFDLRDARVGECQGPIIEAFIDSHEVGNVFERDIEKLDVVERLAELSKAARGNTKGRNGTMSYQLDLDEFTEEELRDELARREEARRLGLCDYCGRNGNATKCRFPNRHPSRPKKS